MSESCGGNCSSCSEACSERKPESLQAQPNPKSKIGKVIAVVSGKGGVGKSTVSAMLATAMQRTGRRAGVLDADITGPSIPKAFGVSECASADEEGIYPAVTESGIQIMSVNLLLEHEDDPVLWRGPIIAGAVKQFWTDVVWENVDYLFVDMPPGTGDVPLTVFQSLPVDGIVIVTSPQELVSMIVAKAVRMAEMMHVPVILWRTTATSAARTAASAIRSSARVIWTRRRRPIICRCSRACPSTPPWRRPAMRAVSNRSTRRSSSLPCRPSSRAEAPFPRNYFPIQGNERRTGAVYIEETVRRKTRGTFSAG